MKTLDEVIKAWSICFSDNSRSDCTGCPYADDDGEAACFNHDREDALHYLKEYRDTKNALDLDRERYIEAVCKLRTTEDALDSQRLQMMWVDKHFAFEEPNNPLDWEELRQMEGKPVWIVRLESRFREWDLVHATIEDEIWFADGDGTIWKNHLCDMGITWQAYRKEKHG